ncbi:MAG: hypothetical protein ACI4UM_03010 [Succinivibrio sp.]
MNKKLLLSIGLASAFSFSGCSIVSSMMTTQDDYLDKASAALDISRDELTLMPETIRPGINDITFDIKDKEDNLYRCKFIAGLTGATGEAGCKKRVGNKWEDYGHQPVMADSSTEWFHFGSKGGNEHDINSKMTNFDSPKRTAASESAGTARPVTTTEVVGRSSDVPTIVFTPEDNSAAFRTNPTKTYNGRFKVRDEQGHSYECHFANVGQVVSDTIAVCNKLY